MGSRNQNQDEGVLLKKETKLKLTYRPEPDLDEATTYMGQKGNRDETEPPDVDKDYSYAYAGLTVRHRSGRETEIGSKMQTAQEEKTIKMKEETRKPTGQDNTVSLALDVVAPHFTDG